jgi:hypothetical protein
LHYEAPGHYVNNYVDVFAIGWCTTTIGSAAEVGSMVTWFYCGDNDAELNHARFGSSEGVARIKVRVADYSNDDLLENGMSIGGKADSVCRQVERWVATDIDQMIFTFQVGRTSSAGRIIIGIVGQKVIARFID